MCSRIGFRLREALCYDGALIFYFKQILMKCMPMWNCTNTLLGNRHTAALRGEMSPPNLFSTVTAALLYAMFPSFQSDEMQLHFYYLPSAPGECCVVSPVILLLVFGPPQIVRP